MHAADVLGRRLAANEDDAAFGIAFAVGIRLAVPGDPGFGIVGEELDDARGRARTGVDALGNDLGLPFGCRIEDRLQELIEIVRRNAAGRQRLFLANETFLDHIDRKAHGGEAGPLAVPRLQHPELAFLDGELNVLHVAIVLLQRLADLFELLVNGGHVLLELGDLLGGADAGNDILALGVDEVLAVEDVFARGRVAREGDAGAAVVAHVAEDHRADIGGRAPILREAVLAAVNNGPIVHP